MANRDDFPSDDALEAYDETKYRIEVWEALGNNEAQLDLNIRVLDRLPVTITYLIGLQTLNLSGTNVSDLSHLSSLSSLRRLSLNGAQVRDLSVLSSLSSLQWLNLRGSGVRDIAPLSNCSGLRHLNLGLMDIGSLSPLSSLSNLRELDLNEAEISDLSPLSSLARLQRLLLGGTQVSDLSALSGLSDLQWLYLDATEVSDLSPLVHLRWMAENLIDPDVDWQSRRGLNFAACPNLPAPLQEIAEVKDIRERTFKALNYIRAEAGLSSVEDWVKEPWLPDEDEEAPFIPAQKPGLSYRISAHGLIEMLPTGQPDAGDIAEIETVREVLLEALGDLGTACQGSNAFATLDRVAKRYRLALEGDIAQISIDQLYAQGVRLGNASARLQADIATGVLPDTSGEIGEALDSVLTLHGTTVLGTKRGRELLARARENQRTQEDALAYREKGLAFAASVRETEALANLDVKDELEAFNEDVGAGDHPERSNDAAETANNNFLRLAGKVVSNGYVQSVAGGAAVAIAPGVAPYAATAVETLTPVALAFFAGAETALTELAAVSGGDLNWLQHFYRWLRVKGLLK